MTVIGTAVLQVIPSLDGVSKSIDKQLDGTLFASGKRGGKQLAKGVGEGLKDLEREVESTGRAYQKLKDRAADALGKVSSEEAKLKQLKESGRANDAQIITATERLNKARRDSTRATRDAEDGHRSLAASQAALATSSGNLGANLGGAALAASRLGPLLASAGAIAGGAALVGVTALAAGALVAVNNLYDLGAQFDDTFDNIRIKTGATGPALQQLEDATKRLSTNVPLSIGEIGNVVAETSRALHLTGPDLDRVAGSIANLGRITGENVDVRTLGKAFRGFGVDAKDQAPALDSLFRASQSTGVGVNELLATVVKGGAGLRQFGFDFGESAALATQFEESGLDADKAMTGLTKGLASLAKNGQTGQQALKDNVAQIKGLIAAGNDAEALDLTNKLFGAKGGVQFFEAIKNGALDLDTLSSALSGTGDTIQAAAADTDDWSERWQTLKNRVSVALEPLGTTVFDSINEQLGNLATWVEAHQDQIVDFFVTIGQGAITGVDIALDAVGQLAQGVGQFLQPFGDIQGAMLDFQAFQAEVRGDDDTAAQLHAQAQEAYGWGEGLDAAGAAMRNFDPQALRDKLSQIGNAAKTSSDKVGGLGTALGALPSSKNIDVHLTTDQATTKMNEFFDMFRNPPPVNVNVKPGSDALAPSFFTPPTQGHAAGGPITGAGGPKSDLIPIWASHGEHMLTASDVDAMGGQSGVYAFRNALHRKGGGDIFSTGAVTWPLEPNGPKDKTRPGGIPNLGPGKSPNQTALPDWGKQVDEGGLWGAPPPGWWTKPINPDDYLFPEWWPPGMRKIWKRKEIGGFAGGGAIGPDVKIAGELAGTAYDQASRTDCSGMVARVIAGALGMPDVGLMSTKNAADWLTARGFKQGVGGPGTISVGWYDHGPNPNDGHMAMTLSDGRNAEAGGSSGPFTIGSATGASSPQFDQHMYLPTVYGEGPAGSSASSPFAGGSAVAAVTGTAQADSSGGGTSSSSSGSSISLPSSLSGFGAFAGEQIGKQFGDEKLGKLTSAAGSLIDGQVASALDVFGIPSNPGWLQGISKLVGGISIGGGDGAALPLASSPSGTGTPPPDDPGNMHGGRAGQAPGPTYNITARDTEDAFVKAQRVERERTAAKLNRF